MKIFKGSKMILHRILYVKHMPALVFPKIGLRSTHQLHETKEEACEYPPIIDMSEEGQKRHNRQMWYDFIQTLPSVEQKLHELAVQQKLKLKTFTLSSVPPTYNGINFNAFITRTHLVNGLPKSLTDMNVDKELKEIRECFCDILLNYYCNVWGDKKYTRPQDFIMEENAGSRLVNQFILQCYKKLGMRNDYITTSTIQQKPRIFSFWWHGGYGSENDELEERNLCFQFEDYATFAIRINYPLLPILQMNDPLCSTAEVKDYHYHPDVFQIPSTIESRIASIPGFWPGDPCEFPFLLVYTTAKLQNLVSQLENYDLNKIKDGTAIMGSFAWLNALATYQGFSPFHDITYPFVTHTIVTNGRDWNFYVYQLNTVAFHNDVDKKDRRNICWSSGPIRLFDVIENGQIKGINDEVFKILLQFLHNAPVLREGLDLKPYLGIDTRTTEEKVNMRYLLRKWYARVPEKMAHREEVPTWVKIYKLHPDAPPSPFIRME